MSTPALLPPASRALSTPPEWLPSVEPQPWAWPLIMQRVSNLESGVTSLDGKVEVDAFR